MIVWDFAALFLLATLLLGAVVVYDRVYRRRHPEVTERPWWVRISRDYFGVVAIVFVIRAFIFDPFYIPSGSMLPTLQIGDMVVVNKLSYHVQLPLWQRPVVTLGEVRRGDVIVFRYPADPSEDFIKRVVGLPGDVVSMRPDGTVLINDVVWSRTADGVFDDMFAGEYNGVPQWQEHVGTDERTITVLQDASIPITAVAAGHQLYEQLVAGGVTVPEGQYFVLGDNRTASADSRFWGFVPRGHIVGRAVAVWMNWNGGPHIHTIGWIN